jgi:hypothetical protein
LQSASTTIVCVAPGIPVPESDCRRDCSDAPGQDAICHRFAAEESSAHVLAWYYVEGRLACRWVAVKSGVEPTTGVEISIAAA